MTTWFKRWRMAFAEQIKQPRPAKQLKRSSLTENLGDWTSTLTTAVVRSCEALGWEASARWNPSTRLPKCGKEFLSIDVTAFPATEQDPAVWPMPVAVFELENHPKDMRVAYSLWKVLCLRAPLRVVFAYRSDWEKSRQLIGVLKEEVIGGIGPDQRASLGGETVVVVGNRGEGETFPWGYFKFWMLDTNLATFEKV